MGGADATSLAARGKSPAAFERPCIPADGVARRSHMVDYARFSRLVSRAPGRSRCDAGFHHELLAARGKSPAAFERPCGVCHWGLRPQPPAVASGDPVAPRRVRRGARCAPLNGVARRSRMLPYEFLENDLRQAAGGISREAVASVYHRGLLDLVFDAAQVHRRAHDAADVQCASLLSVKTGGCPENCAYSRSPPTFAPRSRPNR